MAARHISFCNALRTSLAILALTSGPAFPGTLDLEERLARTRTAVDDLASRCAATGKALPHWAAVAVGRQALAAASRLRPVEAAVVLDQAYLTALRTRIALLEEPRPPGALPPPLDLASVTLRGPHCVAGGQTVYPVSLRTAPPEDVAPFFAKGQLLRLCPALAGVTPETLAGSEVLRVHEEDPSSRRVGWGQPAGGFVRAATQDAPPVLVNIDHAGMRDAIARDTARFFETPPASRPLLLSLGHECFYTDYSPASAARFVAWTKKRYSKPRVAGLVWDMEVRTLGPDLMPTPAQASASPSRWYDWVAFNAERLTGHVRWAVGNVRRAAPDTPVGLAINRYLLAGSLGLSGLDPFGLAECVDVLEVHAASALELDLATALAAGKRPVVERSLPSSGSGPLPRFLRGAAAVRVPSWPPAAFRSGPDVAAATRMLREAVASRTLAEPIRALSASPRPLAFLYSLASVRQAPPWSHRCSRTPYTRRLETAYQAARFLDVGVRFVVPQPGPDVEFPEAPVYVVAGSPVEREPVVRALLERVELGSHLVVIAESFVRDERGREADHLLRLGIEVSATTPPTFSTRPRPELGGALDDLEPERPPRATLVVKGAPFGALKSLDAIGVRQTIQVNVRHDTLAEFADGTEAIVRFARGRGTITYVAMPLVARHLREVLRSALERASVRPEITMLGGTPAEEWGVECRSVRKGKTLLVSLWNTTPDLRRVLLHCPPLATARILTTGKAVTAAPGAEKAILGPLSLPAFETLLLRLDLP